MCVCVCVCVVCVGCIGVSGRDEYECLAYGTTTCSSSAALKSSYIVMVVLVMVVAMVVTATMVDGGDDVGGGDGSTCSIALSFSAATACSSFRHHTMHVCNCNVLMQCVMCNV